MNSSRLIGPIKRNPLLLLTTILWVVITVFIEPGRYSKSELPKHSLSVDSVAGSERGNGKSHFEELHENFFITYPGKKAPVIAYLSFDESIDILLRGGVVSWAETEDTTRSRIDYHIALNDSLLYRQASVTQPFREVFHVDSGDLMSITIDKGDEWYYDEGYFEINHHHPWLPLIVIVCTLLASLVLSLTIFRAPLSLPMVLLAIFLFYFDEVSIVRAYPLRVSLIWALSLIMGITVLRLIYFKRTTINLLKNSGLSTLLFLLLLIPLLNVMNFLRFDKGLAQYDYYAIFQTNWTEAFQYATTNSNYAVTSLTAYVLLALVLYLFDLSHKRITVSPKLRLALLLAALIGMISFPVSTSISDAAIAFSTYRSELAGFIALQDSLTQKSTTLGATTNAQNELHIVVIGESHNKHHMSLYGYHRNTTPRLDALAKQGEIIVMDEAIAHHTHTHPVLELSLSSANLYNQRRFKNSHTIINLLNAADYKTTWLSNQIKIGAWDNHVSLIAMGCDNEYFLNKNIGTTFTSMSYDEIVLNNLKSIIEKEDARNHVIFIHIMGSHGNYGDRWPENREKFQNPTKGQFGNFNTWIVDDYDNSIYYNDSILTEIIAVLNKAPQSKKSLVYFADHSEEVSRGDGHSMALFDYEMTEIPMFWWFSEGYKQTYPQRVEHLNQNKFKVFTNDLIYDQVAEIASIDGAESEARLNLFNPAYALPMENIKLVDQSHPYGADTNFYYIERVNNDSLHKGWQQKLGVHRANTIGKLHHATNRLGFKQVELDVVFHSDSAIWFEIGHGERESMTAMDLRTYLADPQCANIDRFWLDVKNINDNNIDDLLAHLGDSLFQQFKAKLIIESSTKSSRFKEINGLGFYTSYYLPTAIAEVSDDRQLRTWAEEISAQIKLQRVSAVSFDAALYPRVKQYLEPRINAEIEYLSWQLDLSMSQPGLSEKLNSSSVANDQRVKMLLIKLQSKFDY